MGVFNQHTPGLALDSSDSPRGVAQQHDVVTVTLDREILVQRSNNGSLRLGDHGIESSFGYGPTAGNRGEARAAPGAELAIHAVMMKVSSIASSPGGNAFGKHLDNGLKNFSRELPVRIRAAQ